MRKVWRSEDAEVDYRASAPPPSGNAWDEFVKENLRRPVIIKLRNGVETRSILVAQGQRDLLVVGTNSLNWAIIPASQVAVIALKVFTS